MGHRARLTRQGQGRALKKAAEGYWKGRVGVDALRETARDLCRTHWRQPADAGITEGPTGDSSPRSRRPSGGTPSPSDGERGTRVLR
ncbi:hypothetical protein [Streptomyces erythrochromogenes]|uniref:hypothetical protein n=1 Tax=Streptomyces erythrochromogenes TaxID=285574 RepID=UPI00386EED65